MHGLVRDVNETFAIRRSTKYTAIVYQSHIPGRLSSQGAQSGLCNSTGFNHLADRFPVVVRPSKRFDPEHSFPQWECQPRFAVWFNESRADSDSSRPWNSAVCRRAPVGAFRLESGVVGFFAKHERLQVHGKLDPQIRCVFNLN